MLEFLVRVFGVMTAGVFMVAMIFGVLSEFLGIHVSSNLAQESISQKPVLERKIAPDTLAGDLTASLYQMDAKVKLEQNNAPEEELIDITKPELNSIQDLTDLLLENKVMVLLDNSVLSSFLYEEKGQIMTEVLKVHKDYVETSKGGMTFKGGSIYTHLDFLEALEAAGNNFELFNR